MRAGMPTRDDDAPLDGAATWDAPRTPGAYDALWTEGAAGGGALTRRDEAWDGPDEVVGAEPAEAPLARYLAFQARDWLVRRATLLVPIALFGVYLLWRTWNEAQVHEMANAIAEAAREAAAKGEQGPRIRDVAEIFRERALGVLVALGAIGAFLSSFGIVSADRERGLQRFLFAKPVSVRRYYLQKLGVALAGTLAVVALAALLIAPLFPYPVPVVQGLLGAAILAVPLAGLTFLLSTLLRWDAAIAIGLTLAAIPLQQAREAFDAVLPVAALRVVEAIGWLLPPVTALEAESPAAVPLVGAALMLAYGVAYVALGLLVLRRRSITT